MNHDLQLIARHIRWALERQARVIPLSNPSARSAQVPQKEPVPQVPFRPQASNPDQSTPPPPSEEPPQVLEPQQDPGEQPMTIAGYKPEDLIAAPTAPPQPIKTEKRSATHNSSVLFLVGIGVLLAIVGVVLMLGTLPVLGFIVAVVGALAIAASVFVPFKE